MGAAKTLYKQMLKGVHQCLTSMWPCMTHLFSYWICLTEIPVHLRSSLAKSHSTGRYEPDFPRYTANLSKLRTFCLYCFVTQLFQLTKW